MDTDTFDRLARRLAAAGSRRRFVGLAAALVVAAGRAGAAAAQEATPAARPGVAAGTTPIQALPEMVGPFDGLGACDRYLLAGGPFPTDPVHIDDDLGVFVNDAPVFEDDDDTVNVMAPIPFLANPGDTLTVVARDEGVCRKIGALWLHCPSTGKTKFLFGGRDDGCDPARPAPEVFFTQTWTI